VALVPWHDQIIDGEGRPVHVRATVFYRGTLVEADNEVFAYSTGGAQPNPFEAEDGFVQFWANPGAYDIKIEDAINVPPLLAPRVIGFDAVSGSEGGIELFQQGDSVLRQAVPLGGVIDWWRPPTPVGETDVPVPAGFEICDGRPITEINHDFPISGPISLPDLRNTFILGADSTKADTTGGATGDTFAGAPGIRGAGGSNAARNLTHTHDVPAHYHGRGTLAVTVNSRDINHTHGMTGGVDRSLTHAHTLNYTIHSNVQAGGGVTIAGVTVNDSQPKGQIWTRNEGGAPDHLHGTGWMDRSASHDHSTSTSGLIGATGGSNGDGAFATGAASANITNAMDMRPRYYGLLKIMKVRRA
jgi:hypothetical protein